MKQLKVLAADIKDLYYQEHPDTDEAFFDQDFFNRQVKDAYAKLLQDCWDSSYALLRADGRHKVEMVSFDSQWLIKEKVDIKKGAATLKHKPVTFKYDQSNCGVQDILGKCNFIRIKYDEQHKFKHITQTKEVFWWVEPDAEISFHGTCNEEATVYYIPSGDDSSVSIADGAADDIKRVVLALMFEAKKGGYPIDEINDTSKTIKNQQGE